MTISWVAEEKPSMTAAIAIIVKEYRPDAGSVNAIHKMAEIMPACAAIIQLLLLPKIFVRKGMGILSTNGAQTNLNEYPSAAQLKKVTADLSTPASLSQRDRDEKINNMGRPAENPKKTMVTTLGWKKDPIDSCQLRIICLFHF
jgi:hypothetical protein